MASYIDEVMRLVSEMREENVDKIQELLEHREKQYEHTSNVLAQITVRASRADAEVSSLRKRVEELTHERDELWRARRS
jgi:chlorite dismutase